MKKKLTAFVMATTLLCNCTIFSANNAVLEQIPVSAAVTNTVPEGYTPIYTIDDLYAIRNNLSGNYILMNDIDLSETAPGGDWDCGYGWKPIGGKGEDSFSGTFDGNGYAIKNMHIYGEPNETYIGLFGNTYGVITHLALLDCDIDISFEFSNAGDDNIYIGGIAGESKAVLECYITGIIKTSSPSPLYGDPSYSDRAYIGGITGYNHTVGIIKNCFSSCYIYVTLENGEFPQYYNNHYNDFWIGGIVGYCFDECDYNYNVGMISVTKGDKVAYNPIVGNITGDGNLQSCFYLKTDAGYTASGKSSDNSYTNVVGLTKGQMKSSAAYTGFDFDEVWTIDPSADYPYPTLRNVPYVSAGSSSQPSTEPTTNPSSDSSLKGDINGDGKVNATDAAIILVYAAMTGAGHQVSIDDLY